MSKFFPKTHISRLSQSLHCFSRCFFGPEKLLRKTINRFKVFLRHYWHSFWDYASGIVRGLDRAERKKVFASSHPVLSDFRFLDAGRCYGNRIYGIPLSTTYMQSPLVSRFVNVALSLILEKAIMLLTWTRRSRRWLTSGPLLQRKPSTFSFRRRLRQRLWVV